MKNLEKAGIELIPLKEKVRGVLAGFNVCLTGTLSSISRQRAKEVIENEGGHFNSEITSSTNIVVVGANPGSKYQKARERGMEIWDEEKFLRKLSLK